jgi:heptosyltransferase-1
VSWVDQNRRAVARAVEGATGSIQPALLGDPDRDKGRALLEERAGARRPWVGIHLSGGRPVKQWDLGRWQEVAAGLARGFGATIVLTGSNADRVLTVPLVRALGGRAIDLAGRLSLDDTLAVIGALDLFLSSDTGPMHMACAVGTPSVSLFGPSDPARYFSGGAGVRGTRHVVVRADLWCSPCNLIRRPPDECRGDHGPECLDRVQAREVLDRAEELLRLGGYGPCT